MKIPSIKPRALRLFIVLLSLGCTPHLLAQSIQSYVNTDSLTIGETFELSLSIQLDKEYEKIAFPDTNSFPPAVELINLQQYKRSDFSDSLVYNLQFFGNEDLQLPPLAVNLYGEQDSISLFTEPITIYFKTVVAEGDTTLKSMKPNFTFGSLLWPWILAALLAVFFLYWWFYIRDTQEQIEPEPKPTIEPFQNPLKELENQLSSIRRNSDLANTKDFKLFYSEVGDAIRAYYEELYNIPALESTSTELLRYLDAYGVDDILNEKTRKILRSADLVKFAKFTPTLDGAWQMYSYAEEFLERAKEIDTSRVQRLKSEYDKQFMLSSTQEQREEA